MFLLKVFITGDGMYYHTITLNVEEIRGKTIKTGFLCNKNRFFFKKKIGFIVCK